MSGLVDIASLRRCVTVVCTIVYMRAYVHVYVHACAFIDMCMCKYVFCLIVSVLTFECVDVCIRSFD